MSVIPQKRIYCDTCGSEKHYRDCYNCDGEGAAEHDCGDDTCCCLNPVDNVSCAVCEGEGGWMQCGNCAPFED